MSKAKLFFTTILLVVCFLSSPVSAKEAESMADLVIYAEQLPTIPAVIYHFTRTNMLSGKDMIALKYKLQSIEGVGMAMTGKYRVGVSMNKGASDKYIEQEVLKLLATQFKATSVQVLRVE